MWEPPREYDASENPEAWSAQRKQEQELADQATVDRLLRSLRPEDAYMHVFSWETMQRWGIPRRTRRI